jgi:integrase
MRPVELRALAWADVDLDGRVIHVRHTISKGEDGKERISAGTKRGKGRAVAISASLVPLLRQHRRRQNERRMQAHEWHDLNSSWTMAPGTGSGRANGETRRYEGAGRPVSR